MIMPPHEQTNGGQPQNMASTASGGRFIVRTRISSELDEVKFKHHDAQSMQVCHFAPITLPSGLCPC